MKRNVMPHLNFKICRLCRYSKYPQNLKHDTIIRPFLRRNNRPIMQEKKSTGKIVLILLFSLFFINSALGFGKNKVQYKSLNWRFNKLPHFNSYFHQDQGILPGITAQWIENAYTQLCKELEFEHSKNIPLIVFGSPILFEQTNVIPSIIPEGVGGFTEALKNRIVVPFTGSYREYRHVLHHELVHAFQFGILNDNFGSALFRTNAMQLPLWFAEGLAEYLSSGWDSEADMFLMDQTIFGSVPIPDYAMSGYMVYKGGQSFLFFLQSSRGDSAFHEFLKLFTKSKKVEEAIEAVYNENLETLGKEWQKELKRIYWPEIGRREDISKKASALTSHRQTRSYYNLKPRISPDGSKVAYYSDSHDFTKIFISDLTGTVLMKIGQYGYGGYFESFQPFRSGMCWSPSGDRLAFITKNHGVNEIRIIDIAQKKLVHTSVPALAGISSPDWAPNGKMLVFCGLKEHRLDVYLYEIETQSLIQLTDNIQEESDPRFSKDGSSIVFTAIDTMGSADRTVSHLSPKSNLFLIDIASKRVRQLTDTQWNEKHPCFSPDGNSLIFVSDRNGIDNIYSISLENPENVHALTDIIGGCSYPDWASENNILVFNLFQKEGWDVWAMTDPLKKVLDTIPSPTLWVQHLADSTVHYFLPASIPVDSLETMPPVTIKATRRKRKDVDTTKNADQKETPEVSRADTTQDLLNEPTDSSDTNSQTMASVFRDSTDKTLEEELSKNDTAYTTPILDRNLPSYPYKIKFTPDIISVGMAYSSLYGPAGQGIIVFSDLLGDHRIALAGSIQGIGEENNMFASYLNTRFRLDFGIGGFYDKYYTYVPHKKYDYNIFHDTNYGGMMLVQYPFSIYSRVEFNLLYRHLDRKLYKSSQQSSSDTIATQTGDTIITPKNLSLNITTPSLSYVFDNILWGITGPVNGIRAEATLLVAPKIKKDDESFISFDIDFRKYFHIKRTFVWANKIACGFSEPLGSDESARKFFLGGSENWIFYNVNKERYENNLPYTFYSSPVVPFRGWNYFDHTGTRFAVFNTEFRFPFVRSIDMVWPFPIEIKYINGAFFIDIGNAWEPEEEYDFIALPKDIYGGVGFGLRANLGIFILRYDLAWKTDWRKYVKDAQTYFSLGTEF